VLQLESAKDKSTYIITLTFFDETGVAINPTSIIWSLFDGGGNVVNLKSDIHASSNNGMVVVVLQGDDLDPGTTNLSRKRRFAVSALYDASINNELFTELPLNDEIEFLIEDLPGI